MISKLVINIILIYLINISSILTLDNELSQMEENILYQQLNTKSNFNLFYEKILQSNDIDDIARIQNVITQEDIQQFNFENKVKRKVRQCYEKYLIGFFFCLLVF